MLRESPDSPDFSESWMVQGGGTSGDSKELVRFDVGGLGLFRCSLEDGGGRREAEPFSQLTPLFSGNGEIVDLLAPLLDRPPDTLPLAPVREVTGLE